HIIEAGLARNAFWINHYLGEYGLVVADLSPHPFPVRLRRALDRVVELVIERIHRWGWEFVLSPNGLVLVDEKLKLHDETKYVSFLEAAVAWRSGKDVAPHANADAWHREGELRGIKPAMTPDEGEKVIWDRQRDWYMSPVLADSLVQISI